jgi:hypothetical protein
MFRYIETFRPLEVHVQVSDPSEDGLRAHFEYVSSRMKARRTMPRSQRLTYVIQHNGGRFRQANARERNMLADWLKTDAELMRETSAGVGFVIDSTLVRGALTAVFWLSNMPMPHRVHATLDDAVAVAIRELEVKGIGVPEPVRVRGAAVLAPELARVSAG